jgi:DNA-binding response OmpR family regulator
MSSVKSILVVEDAPPMQLLVQGILSSLGTVEVVGTGADAVAKLRAQRWDLVLLDLGLPDMDGLAVYQELRQCASNRATPVIFVSGNEDVTIKVTTFHLGGFDYVTKPFHPLELRVRCERALKSEEAAPVIDLESLRLRPSLLVAEVCDSDGVWNKVDLTVKEFQLLRLLSERPGQVWSRAQIIEKIWGTNFSVTGRVVDTHLTAIRSKIQPYGPCIQSVRGLGYRFQLPSAVSGLKKSAS